MCPCTVEPICAHIPVSMSKVKVTQIGLVTPIKIKDQNAPNWVTVTNVEVKHNGDPHWVKWLNEWQWITMTQFGLLWSLIQCDLSWPNLGHSDHMNSISVTMTNTEFKCHCDLWLDTSHHDPIRVTLTVTTELNIDHYVPVWSPWPLMSVWVHGQNGTWAQQYVGQWYIGTSDWPHHRPNPKNAPCCMPSYTIRTCLFYLYSGD